MAIALNPYPEKGPLSILPLPLFLPPQAALFALCGQRGPWG